MDELAEKLRTTKGDLFDARRLCTEAADRIEALQAELERAREALAPFAKCAEDWIADDEDDEEWAKFRLLIKDFRRARTISEGTKG